MAAVGGQLEQQIVAGDAVNVAARLEQAADSGTILVGERTRSITGGAFRFEGPIPLDLKGKNGRTRAYEVTGVRPRVADAAEEEGSRAGLVGRERELGSLQRSLDVAIDAGRPRHRLRDRTRWDREEPAAPRVRGEGNGRATRAIRLPRTVSRCRPRGHVLGARRDPPICIRYLARRLRTDRGRQASRGSSRDLVSLGSLGSRGALDHLRARDHRRYRYGRQRPDTGWSRRKWANSSPGRGRGS